MGVVSIIACFADSRVYIMLAYCTDHFSARAITKNTEDFPPTRVSRIVVCGPETKQLARGYMNTLNRKLPHSLRAIVPSKVAESF